MMTKEVSDLIKRIVEYKWSGEGDYTKLKSDVDRVEDERIRKVLLNYLNEARAFPSKSMIEQDVEKELLEKWILGTKPIRMRYKGTKYVFELQGNEGESIGIGKLEELEKGLEENISRPTSKKASKAKKTMTARKSTRRKKAKMKSKGRNKTKRGTKMGNKRR